MQCVYLVFFDEGEISFGNPILDLLVSSALNQPPSRPVALDLTTRANGFARCRLLRTMWVVFGNDCCWHGPQSEKPPPPPPSLVFRGIVSLFRSNQSANRWRNKRLSSGEKWRQKNIFRPPGGIRFFARIFHTTSRLQWSGLWLVRAAGKTGQRRWGGGPMCPSLGGSSNFMLVLRLDVPALYELLGTKRFAICCFITFDT